MPKCLLIVKNFLKSVFIQDESVGLKTLERRKIIREIPRKVKVNEFKFSDIIR